MDIKVVKKLTIVALAIILVHTPAIGFAQAQSTTKVLNIGYYPNINHAQAVIGFGSGEFQREFGNNIQVHTFIFNAGSSAIQALLAKRLDVTYVGSGPSVSGYVASQGKGVDLRISICKIMDTKQKRMEGM